MHKRSFPQIYQEAFKNLITDTITFSKLLNEIKDAYERAIQIRDKRISQFMTQDVSMNLSLWF